MAQTRLIGIVFFCAIATSSWAETSSPTLMVTPPQPKWSDLTVPQRIVLAPLSDDWDSFGNFRQKKWLGIAARFPGLSPEEQRRIQKQMQEWGKLTPEQRKLARENYKAAQQLPAEKKMELKQKWEEYASLPQEEKDKLKQLASKQSPLPPALKPVVPNAESPGKPVLPRTDATPPAIAPADALQRP